MQAVAEFDTSLIRREEEPTKVNYAFKETLTHAVERAIVYFNKLILSPKSNPIGYWLQESENWPDPNNPSAKRVNPQEELLSRASKLSEGFYGKPPAPSS